MKGTMGSFKLGIAFAIVVVALGTIASASVMYTFQGSSVALPWSPSHAGERAELSFIVDASTFVTEGFQHDIVVLGFCGNRCDLLGVDRAGMCYR
jgi:hypothetical protein